uniref:Uncharacterized protein n=1 Tax=Arundo donax TaxID=35708 RepID=A0A0A8Y6K8_ARUDO
MRPSPSRSNSSNTRRSSAGSRAIVVIAGSGSCQPGPVLVASATTEGRRPRRRVRGWRRGC